MGDGGVQGRELLLNVMQVSPLGLGGKHIGGAFGSTKV